MQTDLFSACEAFRLSDDGIVLPVTEWLEIIDTGRLNHFSLF